MTAADESMFGDLVSADDEARICEVGTCGRPAQPEHTPCCSSMLHNKSLCCDHYCRYRFVEAHPCSPETHAAAVPA